MNTALVVQKSDAKLGRPAIQITPFKVISGIDRTVYQFVKFGGKEQGVRAAFNDPKVPRQMATLAFIQNKNTFQLCFYPWKEAPQIVEDLPMDELPRVVADLLAAGFGTEEDCKIFSKQHPVPEKILGEFPKLVSEKTLQERDLSG